MTHEQFQNFSAGLDQNIFGNPEFANQGGILQQIQNMGLGLKQNIMSGSPFAFQGGIPQQLQNYRDSLRQNPRAGFGNSLQGIIPENNQDDPEDDADIDWNQIFQETFFPNGMPSDGSDSETGEDEDSEGSDTDNWRIGSVAEGGRVDMEIEETELDDETNQSNRGVTGEETGACSGVQTINSNQKRKAETQNDSFERAGKKRKAKQKRLKSRHRLRRSERQAFHEYREVPHKDFMELMQKEKDIALTMADPQEDAQCTIILLDTSCHIRGELLEVAVAAVKNFLTGLNNIADLRENVSLVSYGDDMCVHQHLTSDYSQVFHALSGIRVAGQSNLAHGLTLCAPVLERLTKPVVNGVECSPRIIIVGDFRFPLDENEQSASHKLLRSSEEMVRNLHTDYNVTVYCIPVIRTFQTIASQLARAGQGMVVSPPNISRLSNLYLQKLLAGSILGERDQMITDETIHCVISMLQFDHFIDDRDVMMIKKIISTTAPDRVGFPTGLVPSSRVNQVQTTEGIRQNGTRKQTKRVSFQDQVQQREEFSQKDNPCPTTVMPGTSGMQTEPSSIRQDLGAWGNDRCPADADDSSNPNSEYSDSESSLLESGLENDDRDYIWLWRDDMGEWKTYPDDVNKKLEKTYRRKPRGTCVISLNGEAERVLFKVMKQRNTRQKKERDVQRLEVDPEMMEQLKSSLYGY